MTVYAGQYGPDAFQDKRGNRVPDAEVTIYEIGTTTKATLYVDRDRSDELANPLPTGVASGAPGLDLRANGIFYADPNQYTMVTRHRGVVVGTWPIVIDVDPDEDGVGTVKTIVPGTGILVDATDPEHPEVAVDPDEVALQAEFDGLAGAVATLAASLPSTYEPIIEQDGAISATGLTGDWSLAPGSQSQKAASLLANGMLYRRLVPDGTTPRLDGLRVLPGLSQWFRNPTDATALLVVGDSTGWSPGTTDGGALPAVGGYLRWVDQFATNLAASDLDATVRLQINDFQNGNDRYQAPRVLKTATGGLRAMRLPGLSNYTAAYPKTAANTITDSFFVGAMVKAVDWTPTNNLTIVSDWGTDSGTWGWSFGLFSDGKLWFSFTQDGANAFNRFSTVALSGVIDNSTVLGIGVEVEWDNGAAGYTLTFKTSPDGHTWTTLGTAVTNAGALTPFQTGEPYRLGCRTDGGGGNQNFIGDVYEIQVRDGDEYGPTLLPTQPDSWNPKNASTLMMVGGPQIDIVNGSWPGMGLDAFDDPANLPLLVPHYPYSGVIVNTGHNDGGYDTAQTLADKWDRLLDRITARAPDAELAVLTQNATLRTDGLNPPALRNLHTARMARLAAYARSRGLGVIDTYQSFVDWEEAGGALIDLLDPLPVTQEIHPKGPGVLRQTQKIWDEVMA